MPPKCRDFADLGAVQPHDGSYRARFFFRDEGGVEKNIYGPSRADEALAQKDLARMRDAAAVGKDRAQGFEIMTMEAW